MALTGSLFLLSLFVLSIGVLFTKGVGIWGIRNPIGWGFAISNFVWWIGIGHAGTFISAILYLANQKWRTSIARLSETMTIFAVLCAGMFPILHLGRPWFFYWLAPYPSTMEIWPQFRSPLVWDMFAVSTYLIVSLLFWFLGLVPDFAIERDQAKSRTAQKIYGFFALGWRGERKHWHLYKAAYLLFAGLATPLVISVHSIVGLDFAASIEPGWHSTLFPPYFVAGALLSGFAMVLTIAIILRHTLHLEELITLVHFDNCAKLLLAMCFIVSYGYCMEVFMAFYSGEAMEITMIKQHYFGPYPIAAWTMIFCNVCVPQILWSPKIRKNIKVLFVVSIFVNVGMWLERYNIIVGSLSRDFLSSSWRDFVPTRWDFLTLAGSFGLFLTGYVLAARFIPMVALTEVREEQNQ
jgi:molybdopterin-containing oxidoreductase family membrane subunit